MAEVVQYPFVYFLISLDKGLYLIGIQIHSATRVESFKTIITYCIAIDLFMQSAG